MSISAMPSLPRWKKRWVRTLRHRAKWYVGARPWLFFPIFRRRSSFEDLLVTKTTDICIEGFPRSANSFAVGAFEHAQSQPIQVAHHTHVPANVMRACQWDIPALVLVRAPDDAIISQAALAKEVQFVEENIDEPVQLVGFHDLLDAWLTFYRSVEPYQDRAYIALFRTTIQDMGRVIDGVNTYFGTNFDLFDHTDENEAAVHAHRGYHAGPQGRRDTFKEEVRSRLEEQLQTDTALQRKMEEAESLFDRLVRTAEGKTDGSVQP